MSSVTVQTTVHAPLEKVWECWTEPEHITGWAFASDDWEAPTAENDLRVGGTFKTVMAAKDNSTQFDFTGTYDAVEECARLEYTMSDGRRVQVVFETTSDGVRVTETFDPESENSEEMQHAGWQAILDNFKKYVENN